MPKGRFFPSFTLLELLIVIGILAVLASVTFIALNPAEQLKRARDTQRLADLRSLNSALSIYESQTLNPVMGSSTVIYVSLPDNNSNCSSWSLPPAPPPYTGYRCVTEANLRKTDGSGWVPVNLAGLEIGSPLTKLPVDPRNNNSYYYTYTTGGSFMLTGLMESTNNKVADQAINDGGRMPGVFEIGSNLTLGPFTRDNGLVGYWSFDEGSGTTAYNYSGNTQWRNLDIRWRSGVNPSGPRTSGKLGNGFLDAGYEYPNDEATNIITNYSNSNNPPQQTDFTTTLWVKINSSQPVGRGFLVARCWGFQAPYYCGYNLYYSVSTQKVTMQIVSDSNCASGYSKSSASNLTIPYDQWTFLALVHKNGEFIQLYINGKLDKTEAYTQGLCQKSPGFSVGCNTNNNDCGVAAVFDEVRTYNRALSEAEIQAIYNATK